MRTTKTMQQMHLKLMIQKRQHKCIIKQWNNTINQENHAHSSAWAFWRWFMEMIPSPRLGFLRGVFLANHLASTDNSTRTTKRQNTQQWKL